MYILYYEMRKFNFFFQEKAMYRDGKLHGIFDRTSQAEYSYRNGMC